MVCGEHVKDSIPSAFQLSTSQQCCHGNRTTCGQLPFGSEKVNRQQIEFFMKPILNKSTAEHNTTVMVLARKQTRSTEHQTKAAAVSQTSQVDSVSPVPGCLDMNPVVRFST